MRNAWRIFKGDVRLVATNAIGLMVAIGLVVVPALGFGAACFASPLAWVFADAFLFPASVSVLRKLEQKNLSRGVDRGGILVAKE